MLTTFQTALFCVEKKTFLFSQVKIERQNNFLCRKTHHSNVSTLKYLFLNSILSQNFQLFPQWFLANLKLFFQFRLNFLLRFYKFLLKIILCFCFSAQINQIIDLLFVFPNSKHNSQLFLISPKFHNLELATKLNQKTFKTLFMNQIHNLKFHL